jgi:pilus assembly protein TadC
MALIEGQQLGTPLADILQTQANQMRQKRTQWAEKASAESEVALVFPAMLIMLGCLILIAAPFVLSALFE